MSHSMGIALVVIAVLALAALGLGLYLNRSLPVVPTPADFHCYEVANGAYVPLDVPPRAFGIGLSYAAHIEETASEFDPDAVPPVFEKRASATIRSGGEVRVPSADELIAAADAFEPGLGEPLRTDFPDLSALLDYEVELGFVLLEDIDPARLDDPNFAPRLGFFIANDLSSRSFQLLGEGQANRFAYWGAAKSFPGFMPIADRAWVPEVAERNGIPCVEVEAFVNGELRQRQSTDNLIYTPLQMLRFVHTRFPDAALEAGTIVLTGTPGGVAMTTPRWLVRLGELLGLDRFKKLSAKVNGDTARFLKEGDVVTVRALGLGKVSTPVVP